MSRRFAAVLPTAVTTSASGVGGDGAVQPTGGGGTGRRTRPCSTTPMAREDEQLPADPRPAASTIRVVAVRPPRWGETATPGEGRVYAPSEAAVARARTGRRGASGWCPCPECRAGPFEPVTSPAARRRPAARDGPAQPSEARPQLTVNRAPPAGDEPTAQRPPVARTMASPIARPRPAPPASPTRWPPSGGSGRRCGRGPPPAMPGPESSTVTMARPPSAADGDVHGAAVRRVLAGVVEQDADEPVDELRRGGDEHLLGRARGRPARRCRVSATAANRSAACAASTPRSTGSAGGGCRRRRRSGRATACPRAAGACASTRGPPVKALRYQAASRSCARASEVCASITDSGVRSSCEASAVNSSWRRRAASMGAATRRPMTTAPDEHEAQQERRDQQHAEDDRPLGVGDRSIACATTT